MLTATYSLVAISAEQKKSRSVLSRLQQYIRGSLEKIQSPDLSVIKAALDKLAQFDQYWHTRKMEMVVIPAVRGTTEEVDSVVAELEGMSARGTVILKSAREKLHRAVTQGTPQLQELYRSLEGYCENLWQRLVKEENELLPMLKRLLTTEQWFPIAAQFLSDDAHCARRKVPAIA